MNDNDTLAVVRDSLATAKDSLAGVHMDTPLDSIARNGRMSASSAIPTPRVSRTRCPRPSSRAFTTLTRRRHPEILC